jgi:hypothetical protein
MSRFTLRRPKLPKNPVGDWIDDRKEGTAQFVYDKLDPYYGEGGVFQGVTEEVRQGDLVGAGVEATQTVFIEPVVEAGVDVAVTTVETITDTVTDRVPDIGIIVGIGALALLLSK